MPTPPEVTEDAGDTIGAVEFADDDTTTSIPFPVHHVFIIPKGLTSMELWSLPHPRHDELCMYITGIVDASYVLCEVQERRHSFGDLWFLGNHVEPTSALNIATPIDPTFVSVSLAIKGGHGADKFVTTEDIVLRKDDRVARLPEGLRQIIASSLRHVCEVKSFGPDESYYKFSSAVFAEWIRRKHQQLLVGGALHSLLGLKSDEPLSAEVQAVVSTKAFALLAEYLHPTLHGTAAEACGVVLEVSKPQPTVLRSTTAEKASGEPEAKKPRVELKSASVKRLEKAGPPKGTPTLMAMFAKKKQQGGEPST